jgi:hypothetical protein
MQIEADQAFEKLCILNKEDPSNQLPNPRPAGLCFASWGHIYKLHYNDLL